MAGLLFKVSLLVAVAALALMFLAPKTLMFNLIFRYMVYSQPEVDPTGEGRSRQLRVFNEIFRSAPADNSSFAAFEEGMEQFFALLVPRSDAVREELLVPNGRVRVPVSVASFQHSRKGPSARAILYFHGGGMVIGKARHELGFSDEFAARTASTVFSVDYRLLANYSLEESLSDCLAVYNHMLTLYQPHQIIIMGCSGGGMATLLTGLEITKRNLPQPAGLLVGSPGFGLEQLLPDPTSYFTLPSVKRDLEANEDAMLDTHSCKGMIEVWSKPQNRELLLSLLDSTANMPRTVMHVSQEELLRSIDLIAFEHLKKQGARIELFLAERVGHCFHLLFGYIPESDALTQRVVAFAENLWAQASA